MKTKRFILQTCLIGFLALSTHHVVAKERMNVLLLITDDLNT